MRSIVNKEYKFSRLTGDIIGCAMRLHAYLGNGYPEIIYQRGLAHEMNKTGITFSREVEMPVYYDGIQIGTRRADFIINEQVVLELKAVSEINSRHANQVLNYLKAYNLEVGLLINFGEESLRPKRFINSKSGNQNLINQRNQ